MFRYLILIIFVACGTLPTASEQVPNAGPAVGRPADATVPLALTVITAADNITRLPGADVHIIHASGRVEGVGVSDQFGRVEVQRDAFLSEEAPAIGVLVCHPVFYCGLLRTDEVVARTESTIALATRVIR